MMVVVIDQLQRWAHYFVRQPGEQRSAIAGCSLANPPLEAHDLCMWMVSDVAQQQECEDIPAV